MEERKKIYTFLNVTAFLSGFLSEGAHSLILH